MKYKRHFFWANMAILVGFVIGGIAWLGDIAITTKWTSTSVSDLPLGTIFGKMFLYPTITSLLAWFLFRFPLMPTCDNCGTRLGYRRQETHRYVCPHCGTTFDTGERVTGAGE